MSLPEANSFHFTFLVVPNSFLNYEVMNEPGANVLRTRSPQTYPSVTASPQTASCGKIQAGIQVGLYYISFFGLQVGKCDCNPARKLYFSELCPALQYLVVSTFGFECLFLACCRDSSRIKSL